MRLPRRWVWLRRGYAALMGYFWLPCPLCGQYFSGAETGPGRAVTLEDPSRGKVACRWCPGSTVLLGTPTPGERMEPGRVK